MSVPGYKSGNDFLRFVRTYVNELMLTLVVGTANVA